MPRIRSLRPNMDKEDAIEHFSSSGTTNSLRELIYGPLRSVADFYIPFQMFKVEIENRGQVEHRVLGLDAVSGALDLYKFDQLPDAREVIYHETRNCLDPVVPAPQMQSILVTKVQRLVFTSGFFRMRDFQLSAEAIPGEIYIPYWVGLRGRGMRAQMAVVDAVRCAVEGGKVKHLLRNWLTSIRQQTN